MEPNNTIYEMNNSAAEISNPNNSAIHSSQNNPAPNVFSNVPFVHIDDIPPPKPDYTAPPPYEVATKLPTYEEVQREKTLQGETRPNVRVNAPPPCPTTTPLAAFLAIDAEANEGDTDTSLLGTDFMFFTAFLVAFLFNWIGFLLLMCFCHTIASRYGALSGFGLSLAKWTLIVKHSTDLASRENSWLWWLIMAFDSTSIQTEQSTNNLPGPSNALHGETTHTISEPSTSTAPLCWSQVTKTFNNRIFVGKILNTQGIKTTAIFTVILLPIRVAIICMLVVTAWFLATIGLFGISEQELREKPLTGWRRKIKPILCQLGQMTYAVAGMSIVIKGKQASREEAPVLVGAPHSTFLDGGIVYITGLPSIIVRRESGDNPYMGKLINYTQPVYVWREDPNSRQNTIKEIIDRATSDQDWPQVLIFPEGTCTNRSCLITFKPGAFYPGVPVQPVCIRYPNKFDTVTWTWEGPGALKLLWLTLTQMHSSCEIEFLPVYHPSEAEKKDPKLYANNVRAVMAKALGIPVSDYTYDDCRIITRAKQMNLPWTTGLVEAQKLRHKLGLDTSDVEEKILNSPHILCKDCSQLTYHEFTNILQIPPNDVSSQQLFRLYDKKGTGVIDFREYLYTVLVISKAETTLDMIEIAFKIYDHSGRGHLSRLDFIEVMRHTLNFSDEEASSIFYQICKNETGSVSFEQFSKYAEHKNEFSHLFNNHHQQQTHHQITECNRNMENSIKNNKVD